MQLRARIRRYFLWRVIDIALRKNVPSVYYTSGESAQGNDLYVVYLRGREDRKLRFVTTAMEPSGLTGKWAADSRNFTDECCVPYSMLSEYRPYIEHHYKGWFFRIWSVSTFITLYLSGYQFFRITAERLLQLRFNKQPLARRDRMKVLNHILEETVKRDDYKALSTMVLTHFYTMRWINRPDNKELMTYYNLLLKSLVETGDLAKVDGGYTLQPKALHSLAEYQHEERRHADNLKIQRGIFYLTLALAVVGIAQAMTGGFAAWIDYQRPPG